MADRLSFFSWMAADDGLDSLSNAGGDGNKNQSDVCKDPICSDTGISASIQDQEIKYENHDPGRNFSDQGGDT